jgi:PilZ domain-containing protein
MMMQPRLKSINTQSVNTQSIIQKWLTEARCNGQKASYNAMRNAPRFQWIEHVTVELLGDDSDGRTVYATTRDVSVAGVGLRLRQSFDLGAKIRVTRDGTDESLVGTVCHCEESLGVYQVGVEFDLPATAQRRSVTVPGRRMVA